jgi:hypothetical protein
VQRSKKRDVLANAIDHPLHVIGCRAGFHDDDQVHAQSLSAMSGIAISM